MTTTSHLSARLVSCVKCWSPASFDASQTGFYHSWLFLNYECVISTNAWLSTVITVDGQTTISLQTQGFCWYWSGLIAHVVVKSEWRGLASQQPCYTPLASLVNRSATEPEDKKNNHEHWLWLCIAYFGHCKCKWMIWNEWMINDRVVMNSNQISLIKSSLLLLNFAFINQSSLFIKTK